MRPAKRAALRLAFPILLAAWTLASAQPLVTGNLTVYYDFDDFTDTVADKSGNGLDGWVTLDRDGFGDDANYDDLPDIRLSTDDKVRGAGSAWFDTDPLVKEDRIQICQLEDPDADNFCDDVEPTLIPKTAFTVAAWMKVLQTDPATDQSLYQSRSFDGSFTHIQVQGNGKLRATLRGQLQADNIVSTQVYTDGTETNTAAAYPFDEWFHFAVTYNQAANNYGMYFNGRRVTGGAANGNAGADEIGDWGMGAWIGLVPDYNRQLVGKIDEFYLFTRALSAAEIQELVILEPPLLGDFDDSGALDAADIDALTTEVIKGPGANVAYDVTADGFVNEQDREKWVNELKWTWFGDADLDGEFNSADFVLVFVAGKYETQASATWGEGDWSGDLKFDSSDFVTAFVAGGYELGKRPPNAPAAVPEPAAISLLTAGALAWLTVLRRRHTN